MGELKWEVHVCIQVPLSCDIITTPILTIDFYDLKICLSVLLGSFDDPYQFTREYCTGTIKGSTVVIYLHSYGYTKVLSKANQHIHVLSD